MRHLFIVLLLLGSLLAFTGYCFAILDWVQDFRTGAYGRNHAEAFLETAGLLVYTYLAIRFIKRKTHLIND